MDGNAELIGLGISLSILALLVIVLIGAVGILVLADMVTKELEKEVDKVLEEFLKEREGE